MEQAQPQGNPPRKGTAQEQKKRATEQTQHLETPLMGQQAEQAEDFFAQANQSAQNPECP